MTDELTLKRAGILNVHNVRYWSLENPRTVRYQIYWSTNAWCGIWGIHVLWWIFSRRSLPAPDTKHGTWLVWRAASPKCMSDVISTWWGPSHKEWNVHANITTEFSANHWIWWSDEVASVFAGLDTHGVRMTTSGLYQNAILYKWAYFSDSFEAAHHPSLSHSYTCYAPTSGLSAVTRSLVLYHHWRTLWSLSVANSGIRCIRSYGI